MPNAENAKLEYEAGQNSAAMGALTDSGDQLTFNSSASLWSRKSGFEPSVKPDGLATGGVVSAAASASDDVVDIAALTAYVGGVLKSVSASADEAITRAATAVASISSITVTSAGVIAVVKGTDSADSSFSEVRDAAGGPPLIPVGSVEIAQVRTTTNAAGPITADEIFQVVGTHQERYDFPLFDINYGAGTVTFLSALPKIHVGTLAKGVFASYAEPIFSEVSLASDFTPAETSHSVSSEQVYGATVGSSSSSLGQGSFTAKLQDGVTDALVGLKNENLWFRFYPNKYAAPYILTQGKLGISRSFPAGSNMAVACTISADAESAEKAS
ncbi:MAG: hypothetical protein RPU42_11140 [Candidatus Sedimenticola sp. (ex Thyasira tokunagai)]